MARRGRGPGAKLAVAGMVAALWRAPAGEAYYLDTMGGALHHAMASGPWVAWGELTQGALASIYAKNLATGELKTIVADDPATPQAIEATANIWSWGWYHPQIGISGDTVAFADRRNWYTTGTVDIRTHHLATGAETVVSPLTLNDNMFPAIDGDWVVWQENWQAYIATVGGAKLRNLGGNGMPDVDGDIVVWKDGDGAGASLRYRNMATRQTGTLFQADAYEDFRSTVIDGSIVAWSMRDQDAVLGTVVRIMAYDMSTGHLKTIKEHTGSLEHRSMVSVSNGVVVWEDWRNSTAQKDIYGYDLATGREFAVVTSDADQRGPSIDGDIITWSEGTVGGRIGWVRLSELLATVLLGDVNLSGTVNALDSSAFVQRLTSGSYQLEADINEDGAVNGLDIAGFIGCLTGGACGSGSAGLAVPEPATWWAMAAGVGVIFHRYRYLL